MKKKYLLAASLLFSVVCARQYWTPLPYTIGFEYPDTVRLSVTEEDAWNVMARGAIYNRNAHNYFADSVGTTKENLSAMYHNHDTFEFSSLLPSGELPDAFPEQFNLDNVTVNPKYDYNEYGVVMTFDIEHACEFKCRDCVWGLHVKVPFKDQSIKNESLNNALMLDNISGRGTSLADLTNQGQVLLRETEDLSSTLSVNDSFAARLDYLLENDLLQIDNTPTNYFVTSQSAVVQTGPGQTTNAGEAGSSGQITVPFASGVALANALLTNNGANPAGLPLSPYIGYYGTATNSQLFKAATSGDGTFILDTNTANGDQVTVQNGATGAIVVFANTSVTNREGKSIFRTYGYGNDNYNNGIGQIIIPNATSPQLSTLNVASFPVTTATIDLASNTTVVPTKSSNPIKITRNSSDIPVAYYGTGIGSVNGKNGTGIGAPVITAAAGSPDNTKLAVVAMPSQNNEPFTGAPRYNTAVNFSKPQVAVQVKNPNNNDSNSPFPAVLGSAAPSLANHSVGPNVDTFTPNHNPLSGSSEFTRLNASGTFEDPAKAKAMFWYENDYSSLASSDAAKNLYVTPIYNNGVLTTGSKLLLDQLKNKINEQGGSAIDATGRSIAVSEAKQVIQKIIAGDYIEGFDDTTGAPLKEEAGTMDWDSFHSKGIGDLDVSLSLGTNWWDNKLYTDLIIGAVFPTARQIDIESDGYLALPRGNNGHVELKLALQGAYDVNSWMRWTGYGGFTFALPATEKIPVPYEGASAYGLLPGIVNAEIYWREFVYQSDIYLYPTTYAGIQAGYQFMYKGKDHISLFDRYARDSFGNPGISLNKEEVENRSERTTHKLKVGIFGNLTESSQITIGFTDIFLGKNAPHATDLYMSFSLVY